MLSLNRRHLLSTLAITGAGLLAASCGPNRVAQCNELIQVINTAVTEVQSVTQSPEASSNPEALVQIADTADRAVEQMQSVELQDEQLVEYQNRFITMYQETSTASRDIYEASQNQNLEEAQAALGRLQAATAPEPGLVNDVNAYCGGQAIETPAEAPAE
jgi:hypothetical protein